MKTELDDKRDMQEEEADETNEVAVQAITGGKNNTASALTWMAYFVLIGGIIIGLLLAQGIHEADVASSLDIVVAIPYWSAGIVFFAFFRGLAEIINLLHKINRKLDKRD